MDPLLAVFVAILLPLGTIASRFGAPPSSPVVKIKSHHFSLELNFSEHAKFTLTGWTALLINSSLILFAGVVLSVRKYRYKTRHVFHKRARAAFIARYAVPITLGLVGIMNLNITEPREGVVVAAIIATSLLSKGSLLLQVETWGDVLENLGSALGHVISTWAAGSGSGKWSGHQGRVPVYSYLVINVIAETVNFAWSVWVVTDSYTPWNPSTDRGFKKTLWWYPQLHTLADELDVQTHGEEQGHCVNTPGAVAVQRLCQSRELCSGVVNPFPAVLFHAFYQWVYIGLTATAIVDSRGSGRLLLVVAMINMGIITYFITHMGGRLLRLLPDWVPTRPDRQLQQRHKSHAMNRSHVALEDGNTYSVETWLHALDPSRGRALSAARAAPFARAILPLRAMQIFEFDLKPALSETTWTRDTWRARVQLALQTYCSEQLTLCRSREGLYESLLTWCYISQRVEPSAPDHVDPTWRGAVLTGLGHVSRLFGEGWASLLGFHPRRLRRVDTPSIADEDIPPSTATRRRVIQPNQREPAGAAGVRLMPSIESVLCASFGVFSLLISLICRQSFDPSLFDLELC